MLRVIILKQSYRLMAFDLDGSHFSYIILKEILILFWKLKGLQECYQKYIFFFFAKTEYFPIKLSLSVAHKNVDAVLALLKKFSNV